MRAPDRSASRTARISAALCIFGGVLWFVQSFYFLLFAKSTIGTITELEDVRGSSVAVVQFYTGDTGMYEFSERISSATVGERIRVRYLRRNPRIATTHGTERMFVFPVGLVLLGVALVYMQTPNKSSS